MSNELNNVATKVKVNYSNGTLELEGSENFVSKYLDEFNSKFSNLNSELNQTKTSLQTPPPKKKAPEGRSKKGIKKSASVVPIAIDLKNSEMSLKEFYSQKKPSSNPEKTTLFVYYLIKYAGINFALPGHILSCYKEMGERPVLNIPQQLRDITSKKAWLETGTESGSVKTTISGDNLIEHDLPRNDD